MVSIHAVVNDHIHPSKIKKIWFIFFPFSPFMCSLRSSLLKNLITPSILLARCYLYMLSPYKFGENYEACIRWLYVNTELTRKRTIFMISSILKDGSIMYVVSLVFIINFHLATQTIFLVCLYCLNSLVVSIQSHIKYWKKLNRICVRV